MTLRNLPPFRGLDVISGGLTWVFDTSIHVLGNFNTMQVLLCDALLQLVCGVNPHGPVQGPDSRRPAHELLSLGHQQVTTETPCYYDSRIN